MIRQNHQDDPKPIEQVQANANDIRSLLAQSTGRTFAIQPIVTFPGWFVEKQLKRKPFAPWVLNPKAIAGFIKHTDVQLSDEDVH